ncbi:methylmalonyl Co-A mutase-associated GTPase MeaB [bacterium]|nr:methylmalonyl Co-A mutase-associated GTPase MeaB [bacterium]
MSESASPFEELHARIKAKDRRALARLVSRLENGELVDEVRSLCPPHDSMRTLVVGMTGSPGAGKSSLTAGLIGHLRQQKKTVAILATDPASPFTGGALLGERVRMDYDPADVGVFMRSFSSRGATGGLSESTADVLRAVEAFGFDVVLMETVGSGQDQLAIRDLVDVLVLVLTPAGGDDIQWEKAGQMEAADLIALNKADLPGTDFAIAGLRAIFELSPQVAPAIVKTIATKGQGLAELWREIELVGGRGSHHPRFGPARRLLSAAQRELRRLFEKEESSNPVVADLIERFARGSQDEHPLARDLLKELSRVEPVDPSTTHHGNG